MQILNKNAQFLCNAKRNLGKKATEDKTLIFLRSLCTRLLKAERFIEIAKRYKILRVLANFKTSTNEHL